METPIRVLSLQASNILRLSAIKFEWKKDQNVLTLGGKNGAGKSSVMNAIAAALGGMALCPDEPLKRGESRGFVELNLDGLVVRREFWRDLLSEQPMQGPPAYGETKSRLIVKNAEGIKQEPAQRLLDRLIDKRTIDPFAFVNDDEKKQAETLRQIVGLDFSAHDEKRSIAYERRAIYSKQYKDNLVLLDAMPKYDDVPDEELSTAGVVADLANADLMRKEYAVLDKAATDAGIEVARVNTAIEFQENRVADIEAQIAQLQVQLDEKRKVIGELVANRAEKELQQVKLRNAADVAKTMLPSMDAIHAKLHDIEDKNSMIRANIARRSVMDTVVKHQKSAEEQDTLINELDALRAKIIRETRFPVDGLGLNHNGVVTFNGIAFKQASTAEQIRVSTAIGFALNPALKLLCIKNGNALDEDSYALVADAAAKAGGQVLMEIVTKNASDVSVFIEDGHN
jgi:DNA repair exonuclease SbcCD ATPase subunit